jgi:hypothetical protein
LERSQQLTQFCGELSLPLPTFGGRAARELHGERGVER